uniref:Putative methyltransferase n=1 Tax=viral metagenome TaxID=1070528 RepID=A0A6M3XDP0_9ZZZZ
MLQVLHTFSQRFYPGSQTIFDGDPNCEHEWNYYTVPSNCWGTPGPGVYKVKGEYNKSWIKEHHQAFCKKCNAFWGQLGEEPTPKLYIRHLVDIFNEVKRVLKPSGVFFLNIGDKYCGSMSAYGIKEIHSTGFQSTKMDIHPSGHFEPPSSSCVGKEKWLVPKQLMLIPHRLAIAMMDEGWLCRNDNIWIKIGFMPHPVQDRFVSAHEYVFMFTKTGKYYFDLDKVREKSIWADRDKRSKFYRVPHLTGKSLEGPSGFKGVGYNPLGKNPGDVWKGSPKYQEEEGHSSRQGLERPMSFKERKIFEGIQIPIAEYLKKYIKKEHKEILDKEFGEYRWTHWIRTDTSGSALPSPDDWRKLKEILNLDNSYDDIMTSTTEVLDGIYFQNKGRNPGDVWEIKTSNFKGSHFAVFPPELVERCIKAGCPSEVCSRCGKPKKKVFKIITRKWEDLPEDEKEFIRRRYGTDKEGKYSGTSKKDTEGTNDPSSIKRRIINSMLKKKEFQGWVPQCKCKDIEWSKGLVLDTFAGSGTTLLVARNLGRDFIGIEISEKYVNMIKNRLNNSLLGYV